MSIYRRSILLLFLLLAGLLAGCSDEAVPPLTPDPDDEFSSPERLVQHFQIVYETMDPEAFALLLHAQYSMPLQLAVAAEYPDLGPALERDEVLRIHDRLFSHQTLTDPDQQPVPAAQSIAVQSLQRLGAWTEAAPGEAYPGTIRAGYGVVMLMDRGTSESVFRVQGTLEFHLAMRDTSVNGITRTYYKLRALTDLTQDAKADKGVENVSFGRLLGFWR
ncbi:MAG: hypothetical protein IPH48_05835 [bacterium]|nr:hypothetical protein [bacterium]